jgi:hypothetical protein
MLTQVPETVRPLRQLEGSWGVDTSSPSALLPLGGEARC